jgi:small nuclear ribonucleoprotein (snRNP)-like protein
MKTTQIARAGLLAAVLVLATGVTNYAEEAGKPGLSTSGSLREALGRLGEGREVELVLSNGKSYRGKLGSVGSATVIVSQIAGKEFYDVLIALDAVAAVEVRVRSN